MDSWKSYSTRSDNYAAEKAAALAQSKQNSYMQGMQSVHETGFGQSISDSRDGKYGNVNIMPQQVIQGADNNFQQPGDAGSMPLASAANQTGCLKLKSLQLKNRLLTQLRLKRPLLMSVCGRWLKAVCII